MAFKRKVTKSRKSAVSSLASQGRRMRAKSNAKVKASLRASKRKATAAAVAKKAKSGRRKRAQQAPKRFAKKVGRAVLKGAKIAGRAVKRAVSSSTLSKAVKRIKRGATKPKGRKLPTRPTQRRRTLLSRRRR